jgi:hypothetical protein
MKKLKLTLTRQNLEEWRSSARNCAYALLDGRGQEITTFCPQQFHAATGFSLKPGEEKRIEISIKVVK